MVSTCQISVCNTVIDLMNLFMFMLVLFVLFPSPASWILLSLASLMCLAALGASGYVTVNCNCHYPLELMFRLNSGWAESGWGARGFFIGWPDKFAG